MTSSEFSPSSDDEVVRRSTRPSRSTSRPTPRKSPARSAAKKRTVYTAESSDEEDAQVVIKRTRGIARKAAGGKATETPAPKPKVTPKKEGNNKTPTMPTRAAKQTPTKPVENSEEREEESPPTDTARGNSSEEEEPPKSPKKVFFSDKKQETSSSNAAVNGAARTDAKNGNDIPGKDLMPAMAHNLKINTAMMGDLAAEIRLLRETVTVLVKNFLRNGDS